MRFHRLCRVQIEAQLEQYAGLALRVIAIAYADNKRATFNHEDANEAPHLPSFIPFSLHSPRCCL